MEVRLAALSLCLLALSVGGCGEDEPRAGGAIVVAHTAQPDALDPALSYTEGGWQALWLVYTPLLTYRRAEGAEGAELIPGLAEQLPEISSDGGTYRLRLRKGLEYSDGTPVRARDFEHTIRRVLALESPGSSFFLGIEGAQRFVERGDPGGDIAGIETDDRSGRITIRLTSPDGTFSNVLAMTFGGLVPSATPVENLTANPPPGAGPYRIAASTPNRRFVLERNGSFDVPGIPPGRVDEVTVRIVPLPARAAQDVLDGRLDSMLEAPPPDLLRRVREEAGERYEEVVRGATTFFFLNQREEPFDDERVRRAVNHAVDQRAIQRLLGGLLEPGCTFIPPVVPGHEASAPCPYGVPDAEPDLGQARRLIEAAGAAGAEVAVWGVSEPPGSALAAAYADMLERIGLDTELKSVAFGVFFQTVSKQSTQAQTGLLSFSQDFPHPSSFVQFFDGSTIGAPGTLNLGNVDDPRLTETIQRLRREPDLSAAAREYAAVDREAVERAYAVPVGYPKGTLFTSERIDFEDCARYHPVFGMDYSSLCLE